ncbi:MAG: FAD-binding oxidoreductase [Gemmatimonadaceae bacterium]|nr:FAD-binding oxidoreductase [Gemmatimonadaceae bacterium]
MSIALLHDADLRAGFTTDASGLQMLPDAIARPESVAEAIEILKLAATDKLTVTAAGGQTSTTGAGITDRGVLLSLRALTRVLDIDTTARTMRCEAGVIVLEAKRAAAEHGLLLPLDPTSEPDCTVGGAVACNASGARSLAWGVTRRWVRGITVALASGEVLHLRRPALEKNTVGFEPVQDLVDWFVGCEGTLGVVLEVEFALLPLPARMVGLAVPFDRAEDALAFVVAARESADVSPRCLEYLDAAAVTIAREAQHDPAWAANAEGLVYLEQDTPGDEPPLDAWLALAEAHQARVGDIRVYESEAEQREAKKLRHHVPARLYEFSGPLRAAGGRRVSTDWAVPYRRLGEALAVSRRICLEAGVETGVTFGHAGNGHPHQNFLGKDAAEVARIEGAVEQMLKWVVANGGTVAAEHGIGKVKRKWASLMLTPTQVALMRAAKQALDPEFRLAPGNLL